MTALRADVYLLGDDPLHAWAFERRRRLALGRPRNEAAAAPENRTANLLLAVALIAFCVHMISIVYHAMELEQVFPHFFGAAYRSRSSTGR